MAGRVASPTHPGAKIRHTAPRHMVYVPTLNDIVCRSHAYKKTAASAITRISCDHIIHYTANGMDLVKRIILGAI